MHFLIWSLSVSKMQDRKLRGKNSLFNWNKDMGLIFLVVREEDTHLQSPFTQPLSASMMILKEKQSKEKAHPPGTSKILAKARKKAMEEEKKVCCFYLKRNLILIYTFPL